MIRAVMFASALTVGLAGTASAQIVAITNTTVFTDARTSIADATIVIDRGRVTGLGAGIAVPANATVIDGTGKVVTAGFVDSSSNLGLSEVGAVSSTNDGRFYDSKDPIHAAYRVTDGYNPLSVSIPLARTGGVTAVVATPRGGLVSGTSAWMSMRSGPVAAPPVAAPLAMYVTLGENAMPAASGSRGVAVERLRELLDDAAQYARRRGKFENNQTREFAAERLDLEALVPVVQGRLPLVVRADKASDIAAALRLAADLRVKVIIEGGVEAWLVARELATARVPVILDPLENLPGSFDTLQVRDDNARLLADAGVLIALSTLGDGPNARNLRQRAGDAIANGLPREAALAAITTNPAQIFGVRGHGTIARGQRADLVVWSGDPFEHSSRVEHVFIDGAEQSLETRQKRLLERYRTLPARR